MIDAGGIREYNNSTKILKRGYSVSSRRLDVAGFLAKASRLREATAGYSISDEALTRARRAGAILLCTHP